MAEGVQPGPEVLRLLGQQQLTGQERREEWNRRTYGDGPMVPRLPAEVHQVYESREVFGLIGQQVRGGVRRGQNVSSITWSLAFKEGDAESSSDLVRH